MGGLVKLFEAPIQGKESAMAIRRRKDRQGDLMVSWSAMPRFPGHVSYDFLQSLPLDAEFEAFVEAIRKPYCVAKMGEPSVSPF